MSQLVRCSCCVLVASVIAVPRARADDPPLKHASVIDDVLVADAQLPEMTPAERVARAHAHAARAVQPQVLPAVHLEPVPVPPCAVELESAATPGPVFADHAPGIDREVDAHWVGEIGMRYGGSRIDGVDGGDVAELIAAGGVHLNRITLLAEYGVSLVHHDATGNAGRDGAAAGGSDTDQTTDGVMHRIGGVMRYAFWRAKSDVERKDHDTQGVWEMYVQGGGGAEIIQWDQGGRLVRPEASVGIGMLGAYRSSAHRRTGWFAGVKLQVARRIDEDGAAATCAAPCTTATPPVAWSDRSYLFETGFLFGN